MEYYELMGERCGFADALSFVSKTFSDFIAKWHVRLYRHAPKLFDKGYTFTEDHPELLDEDSAVYHIFASGAKKLADYIKDGGYDAVVCTHVFAAAILTEAKREYSLSLRTSVLITDYTVYPMVSENDCDFCFIPTAELTDSFVGHGVMRERIVVSGLPVRRMFYNKQPQSAVAEYAVADGKRHMILMCGSMGCGPMKSLVREIAERLDGEREVLTVVCGTNEKLLYELEHDFGGSGSVRVLGFVGNVSALMDTADLYLTKPGGISVTEAAVKRLPMVFVDAVAGCEEGNRRYFVDCGGAVTTDGVEEVAQLSLRTLRDIDKLRSMSSALAALSLPDAAAVIYHKMHEI